MSKSSLNTEGELATVLWVEVLFCPALELGPEPPAVFDEVFAVIFAEIGRNEGIFLSLLGDEMVAVFGVSPPRREHALQGVQAALAIRRGLASCRDRFKADSQVDVQVRMGLNSGVVVDDMTHGLRILTQGSTPERKIAILGDRRTRSVVLAAARLASIANTSEVLVSSAVKDLVTDSEVKFEFRGTHTLQDVSGDYSVYAVVTD